MKAEAIRPGTMMRCVDARVRKVAPGAVTSDFEKAQAGIIEVMEVLTVREVLKHKPFGDAWAVRFVEIERRLEGIRRHRAKKVYDIDRPFLLDRFVLIRDGGGDDASAVPPSVGELA